MINVGGVRAKDRKVVIAYKDTRGQSATVVRWLSQVQTVVDKYTAAGCSEFRFRLHYRAPWHRVAPTRKDT